MMGSDMKESQLTDNKANTLIQLITAFNVIGKMCEGVPDKGQHPRFQKGEKLPEALADNTVTSLRKQRDEFNKAAKDIRKEQEKAAQLAENIQKAQERAAQLAENIQKAQAEAEQLRSTLLEDIARTYEDIVDVPRFSVQVQPQD